MSRLDDIANYAETHDFSAEMDNGTWETGDQDSMVSTSLRLPKSLLDRVRAEAAGQQTEPATFIRQLISTKRRYTNVPVQVTGRECQLVFPSSQHSRPATVREVAADLRLNR